MKLPDGWNPRLRLRDWLNKPSRAERETMERNRLLLEQRRRELSGALDKASALPGEAAKFSLDLWGALHASLMSSISIRASSAAACAAVRAASAMQVTPEISARAEELLQEADRRGLTPDELLRQFPELVHRPRTIDPGVPPPSPLPEPAAGPAPAKDRDGSQ